MMGMGGSGGMGGGGHGGMGGGGRKSLLTKHDHKQIALRVAGEIKNVLADHNGARLLAKYKAKQAQPADPMMDDEDMEGALGMMDDEGAEMGSMHGDPEGAASVSLPTKATGQGFPFHKAGGGMRGRGFMEAALGQPDDEGAEGEMPPMSMPGKTTGKGFPFKKSGGGMRGRGMKMGGGHGGH